MLFICYRLMNRKKLFAQTNNNWKLAVRHNANHCQALPVITELPFGTKKSLEKRSEKKSRQGYELERPSKWAKTKHNFSLVVATSWLRLVSRIEAESVARCCDEGFDGNECSRLWSEHTPFLHIRGYPAPFNPLPRTRFSFRPPPRQALSGNAQIGLEISNLHPRRAIYHWKAYTRPQLFLDFHISIFSSHLCRITISLRSRWFS